MLLRNSLILCWMLIICMLNNALKIPQKVRKSFLISWNGIGESDLIVANRKLKLTHGAYCWRRSLHTHRRSLHNDDRGELKTNIFFWKWKISCHLYLVSYTCFNLYSSCLLIGSWKNLENPHFYFVSKSNKKRIGPLERRNYIPVGLFKNLISNFGFFQDSIKIVSCSN